MIATIRMQQGPIAAGGHGIHLVDLFRDIELQRRANMRQHVRPKTGRADAALEARLALQVQRL